MRPGTFITLCTLALACSLGGCSEETGGYCESNAQCMDPTWEHFVAGHPWCDPLTHRCRPLPDLAPPADGPEADGGTDADGSGPDIDTRKEQGAVCGGASECKTGFCTDGVCCVDDCPGNCRSCNVLGSVGTCALVLDGDDPDKDCAGSAAACDGVCNGSGGCRFPDAAQDCGAASCAAGKLTEKQCDGLGGCSDVKTSCGGYACNAGGSACLTACSGGTGCETGFFCEGTTCKGTLPNGDACGTNNDACSSGICADGVCCNKACTGTCEYCKVAGHVGNS